MDRALQGARRKDADPQPDTEDVLVYVPFTVHTRSMSSAAHLPVLPVLPSNEARTELPKALKRFRAEGALAEPMLFGSHRRPEAAVIPFELYSQLLPVIEDLEIAQLVRARHAAGPSTPLADIAAELGLDSADYA